MKKKWKLGLLLCITLPDQAEADLIPTGTSYDANGNLTINAQKVLKDDKTGETVNDGPALVFTDPAGGPNATAVGAAINTALLNLYTAGQTPAEGATPPATS